MKLIKQDKTFAIVDDTFEPEVFQQFYQYFGSLEFAYRSLAGWEKVWRLTDGMILAGKISYHRQAPFNTPIDWLHQTVVTLAKTHAKDVVGDDWNEIGFTPYIYPPGTKISWHDDINYKAACIFYTHNQWSPHWGGELLVAKTPEPKNVPSDILGREQDIALLNEYGMGHYISPLPNRLVFTGERVWHSINRVDQAAGDHCRCSIVGFFTKE